MLNEDAVKNNPVISKIMDAIMVSEHSHYQGVILSSAKSEGQYWHRDCNTLQNTGTCGSQMVKLDDFLFTVLIPC